MMKLTFEEVLDYLESGRENPAFEQRIEDDPNGRRLREEAELFLELLRDRAKDEDDDGDRAYEAAANAVVMRVESAEPLFDLDEADESSDADRRINPKTIMRTADLATRAAGRVHELGVLELSSKGPFLELVFHSNVAMYQARRNLDTFSSHMPSKLEDKAPSRARRQKFDKQLMSFMATGAEGRERNIVGRGIEIRLPDRVDLSGPIRLEVRDTRVRVPARGLEMVFMPEIGPYSRLVTNSKGMVDLPVPDRPGVLRIETAPPQTVRIELKNS